MVNQFDNRAGQKHVLNRFYVSVIIEWVGITTVSSLDFSLLRPVCFYRFSRMVFQNIVNTILIMILVLLNQESWEFICLSFVDGFKLKCKCDEEKIQDCTKIYFIMFK